MFSFRLHFLTLALFAILAFLQYRLWFESGGIIEMRRMKAALAEQAKETETIKKGNDVILSQINRLQKSEDSTESHARNELGMIKKDETFYQIVK